MFVEHFFSPSLCAQRMVSWCCAILAPLCETVVHPLTSKSFNTTHTHTRRTEDRVKKKNGNITAVHRHCEPDDVDKAQQPTQKSLRFAKNKSNISNETPHKT